MLHAGDGAENSWDTLDLSVSEDHLGLPDAGDVAAIQRELQCDVTMAVTELRRRSGRGGRKPGAKNRRSEDFARYLLRFGPHPGVAMMRTIARPVEMLAVELGCDKLEAASLQQRAAAELLPYFEGKKPVEVTVNSRAHMTLIMESLAPGGSAVSVIEADPLPLMSFAEVVQNQTDSASRNGPSE